jgi:DNA-binding CsgD family transcriptional regulator
MYAARDICERNNPAQVSGDLPQLWAHMSAPILELLQAQKLCIIEHDFGCNRGYIPYSSGLDADLRARYRSDLSAQNVWLQALRSSEPGETHVSAELVPNWELVRTTFYRHWLRPQQVLHALIGVISRSREGMRCLFALREASYAPFASTDRKLLASFLPELRSASEVVAEMVSLRQLTTILVDLVEEISAFAVIVDAAAHPILLNGAAKAFLAHSHGLTLVNEVLACSSAQDTCRLHEVISAMVKPADGRRLGESIAIGRENGDPPIILHVLPLPHPAVDGAGRSTALAVVFVASLAYSDALEACLRFYGMTPAETRLAAMIVGGVPLLQAARELHVTQNTARTHMKHIYAKTETHSPAALIRLLITASEPY